MSMDLAVWSPQRFELPLGLPEPIRWEQSNDEWELSGDEWHILVLPGSDKDTLKIPEHVLAKRPAARQVVYVTLEPIGAGPGYEMLNRVVRTLAREYDGVWTDGCGHAFHHDEGDF